MLKKIIAVKDATYVVAKRKPEKIQACRDSNYADFCNTWQNSNQLSWEANRELVIKLVLLSKCTSF